jgi:hypothetical protein
MPNLSGNSARAEKEGFSGWERFKISSQDESMLKKMGLLRSEAMQMPGNESDPNPPEGFRVLFTDLFIHGLSVPVHELLRGLLFVYEIQLHQLTPKSILHISISITWDVSTTQGRSLSQGLRFKSRWGTTAEPLGGVIALGRWG